MVAARDLTVGSDPASRSIRVLVNGHSDSENFAGDGGTVALEAGRNLRIASNVRLEGLGSKPDGVGADMYFVADQRLAVDGDVSTKGRGVDGQGGPILCDSGGVASIGATAQLIATGGKLGGGFVEVAADGDLRFAGSVDVGSVNDGDGGNAVLSSEYAGAILSGRMSVKAGLGFGEEGYLQVRACRVLLDDGALMRNEVEGGENELTAYESMSLLAGSAMLAPSGRNTLVYPSANPPVIDGTVSPEANRVENAGLGDCSVCGNEEIEGGESCDDGNTAAGDGGDSDCLAE